MPASLRVGKTRLFLAGLFVGLPSPPPSLGIFSSTHSPREGGRYARSYALEAGRKMGAMLRETERARPAIGSKVIGNQRVPMKEDERPTLAELGLTKRESSEAQFLVELPDEDKGS